LTGSALPPPPVSADFDGRLLARTVRLALAAEEGGNLPIAALLVLDGEVVAEAANRTLSPAPHPGRHAEVLALAALPEALVPRLPQAVCYTTLEPCLMCFGALVLHRVGSVVYGARDPLGGALSITPALPPYVAAKARNTRWIGPAWPEACDPLCERALARSGAGS
jgi:tRNA(adenine34) deaminase